MDLVLSPFRGTLRVVENLSENPSSKTVSNTEEALLPWWMNPLNIILMVVVAAVLSAAVAFVIGESRGQGTHNNADIGFLQDMRIHHDQAVNLGLIYLDTSHGGTPTGLDSRGILRLIAREIIVSQSAESGRMVQMLRQFNAAETNESDIVMAWMSEPLPLEQMPGYATDAELDQLHKATGVNADQTFIKLMIAHHLGGIHMLEYIAMHGKSGEVRLMANAMLSAQKSEINELKNL